jgi:serine/threonine-protein kinase
MDESLAHTIGLEQIGRYRVVGKLATGGMAEILLGKLAGPAGFERAVVIKRILPHYVSQPTFVNMLLDEARIVAQIRHPNVVQVYELGHEDGELFLAQEYLEGESAAGLLRRLVRLNRELPCGLAASVVADACAGLHAAHELTDREGRQLEVVHRDVSPENLFVQYSGTAKMLDFGIALARGRLAQTETGQLKGKFGYMSPEQCTDQILDARSDVFAIGIVLHELITSRRLFRRTNALATIKAICEQPIPPVTAFRRDCPSTLARICARSLERAPEDRYQTAAELRSDLLHLLREIGPADPVAALSTLMTEVFPDRIAEKRRMLARIAVEEQAVELPAPEADAEVELLQADTAIEIRPVARRHGGARVAFVVLALGAAMIGGGTIAWRRSGGAVVAQPGLPPTAPIAQAPQRASAPPPSPPAPPEDVTLHFSSRPAGAHVSVDGRQVGETPCALSVARGSTPLHVALRLAGYAPEERELTPLESQTLDFSLAVTKGAPRPARPAHERPVPRPSGFHKF